MSSPLDYIKFRNANRGIQPTFANPLSTRSIDSSDLKKDLRNYVAPIQLARVKQDIAGWRDVINEVENVWYPHRVKLQRLAIDTILDGHVSACMDRRRDMTLLRKWEFVNKKGDIDQKTTDIFLDTVKNEGQNKQWFNNYLFHSFNAIFYGYTLITLGSIINNEFPNLNIIKRWNVSPDRLNVTNFTYSISGAKFMEEPYCDWHVYVPTTNEIGTSESGYGILYLIALYSIHLRNLLGFNSDYAEISTQPYRVGKTTKIDDERDVFSRALQELGANGSAIIDPQDEIEFLNTSNGSSTWQVFGNYEKRLQQNISKIILGHADAIDSIPGKLGNSGVKSPAEKAMEDKQVKDSMFMSNVVNNLLLPKMRTLGFIIPEDTVAVLKNDAEIVDNQNAFIDQSVRIKQAGLQVDADEFTNRTGIKVTNGITAPVSNIPFNDKVKNKLEKLYGHKQTGCGHSH
jgi:phage gp29-like protein